MLKSTLMIGNSLAYNKLTKYPKYINKNKIFGLGSFLYTALNLNFFFRKKPIKPLMSVFIIKNENNSTLKF